VHDVRLVEVVAQEPKPGDLGREAELGWLDVDDMHFEQVAWLGAVHVDGAGQWVHHVQVHVADLFVGRARGDLSVSASSVSRITRSPGATRSTGGISGCHRLWPTWGCAASGWERSTLMRCTLPAIVMPNLLVFRYCGGGSCRS
jgi:hypothetical protein